MTFILYQGRGLDPTNTWGCHTTKPQLYHLNIHLEPYSRFTLLLQQFACHLPSRLRPFFDFATWDLICLVFDSQHHRARARARTLDGGLDSAQLYLLSWLWQQNHMMVDNGWVGKMETSWLGRNWNGRQLFLYFIGTTLPHKSCLRYCFWLAFCSCSCSSFVIALVHLLGIIIILLANAPTSCFGLKDYHPTYPLYCAFNYWMDETQRTIISCHCHERDEAWRWVSWISQSWIG